jgi:hypothetical protein
MEDIMSTVTWFKIFPEGNQCFIVAYAGSEPIIALRTTKKEELIDFLKDYPNARFPWMNGVIIQGLGIMSIVLGLKSLVLVC